MSRYAHVEREVRWLLATAPHHLEARRVLRIEDRYLTGTRLRLRRVRERGWPDVLKLGQKVPLEPTVLPGRGRPVAHTTLYLDEEEYAGLAGLPAHVLVKTRALMDVAGTHYAVDVFQEQLTGLVLAETDLGATDVVATDMGPTGLGSTRTVPFAVLADVTNDDTFTGAALASRGEAALAAMQSRVRAQAFPVRP